MDPTINDLFGGYDDPQQRQQALLAQLRGQQNLGSLALLSGAKSMQPLGQNLLHSAAQGQALMQQQQEHALNRALRQDQLKQAAQYHNDLIAQRQWQAEQMAKDRAAGRANALTIAGMRQGANQTPTLTPEAIDLNARAILKGQPVQNLGRGAAGAANYAAVYNRAAEIDPNADLATLTAGYKANTGSLNKQTQMGDAVQSFGATAIGNLKRFVDAASKIPGQTRFTPWNALVRTGAEMTGNEAMAEFNAAKPLAIAEIARVVTQPNLTGQLTDEARKEVYAAYKPGATDKQIARAAQLMYRDIAQREKNIMEQKGIIQQRIANPGANPAAAAPPPAPGAPAAPGPAAPGPAATHALVPDPNNPGKYILQPVEGP